MMSPLYYQTNIASGDKRSSLFAMIWSIGDEEEKKIFVTSWPRVNDIKLIFFVTDDKAK
jgi:hypothetical protein